MKVVIPITVSLALCCAALPAQSPRLVADINDFAIGAPSSNPEPWHAWHASRADLRGERFLTIGGYTYFVATTTEFGCELYRTSGGTSVQRLTDISPGWLDSNPAYLTALGTQLFFYAIGPDVGAELYAIDTSSATPSARLVKDIQPGPAFSYIERMLAFKGRVYFSAVSPGTGSELWASDGTEAGTVLVKDISPGPSFGHPTSFAVVRDKLFFVADDGQSGQEPWISDGTTVGTHRLAEIVPGTSWLSVTESVVYKNELFFSFQTLSKYQLWRTDGTAQGTRLAHDVVTFGPLVVYRNDLFFAASIPGKGTELCKSDGLSLTVIDLAQGASSSFPTGLTVMGNAPNDKLIFNTSLRVAVVEGASVTFLPASDARGFVRVASGDVYFSGLSGVWRSDGSSSGTTFITAINPNGKARATYLTHAGGDHVLFAADGGPTGVELWSTDGTASGTRIVQDLELRPRTRGSDPGELVEADGMLYFAANSREGRELFRSDGTSPGTKIVASLPGFLGLTPESLLVIGDKLFFTALTSSSAREPHCFDLRTESLTTLDVRIGAAGSQPGELAEFMGRLWFQADGDLGSAGGSGAELWSSDGTVAGTHLLKDINTTTTRNSSPASLTRMGNKLYFAADDGVHGRELWVTDGSAAGTRLVLDIQPGPAGSNPERLSSLGGRLIFAARSPRNGVELYASDGTASGTVLIDINPGPADSNPNGVGRRLEFVAAGGWLYFSAVDGVHGHELWRTDGTVGGTKLVRDIAPGAAHTVLEAVAFADGLLFRAHDTEPPTGHGSELWRTDGTMAGTHIVKDIVPGGTFFTSSYPHELAGLGTRRVFFAASDFVGASEPWVSDGTEQGTRRLAHMYRENDALGARVRDFTVVNGTVFFTAVTAAFGRELWAMDADAVAKPYGSGCSASREPPALRATDPVLGGSFTISVSGAAANSAGMGIVGARATGANVMAFQNGCTTYVDLSTASMPIPFRTNSMGSWSLILPIPDDARLIGAIVPMQSAVGPTGTGPFGLDLSNLLLLHTGR